MNSIATSIVGRWGILILLIGSLPAPLRAQEPVPHVFLISLDGLSSAHFQQAIAAAPESYTNFTRLIGQGASTLNARCDFEYSETLPNHATILTGRPVLQPSGWPDTAHHGYTINFYVAGHTLHQNGNPNVSYIASVFDVVHDHGLATAFYASKGKFVLFRTSYDAINGAPDLIDADNGQDKMDVVRITSDDSVTLMAALAGQLATNPPSFLFLHLYHLDIAGHSYGWGSSNWNSTLVTMDVYLGQILEAIAANPELNNQTTVLITTDHGGGDPANTHVYPERPLNYTIPFLVYGPGWPAGADLYRRLANRFDPGTNRLDYTAARQPVRNGDAPNLALALLGLPPVPGSSLHPVIGPKISLTIAKSAGQLRVSWPYPAPGYRLETSANLAWPGTWQVISNGIVESDGVSIYEIPIPATALQVFRLRLE